MLRSRSVIASSTPSIVHYLPLATTLLAVAFAPRLLLRYRRHGGLHQFWWGLGVVAYGLGTALESAITLGGNSVALTKAWYIAGALLGGYPLAQGTVHLLLSPRTARRLTICTLPVLLVLSGLVIASPVVEGALEPHRPTGAILGWTWVRALTPLVNGYAAVFLIGGAVFSAVRDTRSGQRRRALGNCLIAMGALLPGIGGGMAKAGIVEALYIGEFIGLVLIWLGASMVSKPRSIPVAAIA